MRRVPVFELGWCEVTDGMVGDATAYAEVIVRCGPFTASAFFRPALLEVERLDVP